MNSLAHRFTDERGMTLAEILVATVIIGVGIVGLAVVIPLSSYGVHEGNALSTATFLAEQRMEEIRNAAWTAIPAPGNDCLGVGPTAAPTSTTCTRIQPTGCNSGVSCTTYPDEASVTGYAPYSRNVRVVDCNVGLGCAGVTNANMRLVRVTVTYTPISGVGGAPAGATKSAVLEMIVSRRQ
jgi:prepilin-type N-terminal cleavage/methylation domain-containing protein